MLNDDHQEMVFNDGCPHIFVSESVFVGDAKYLSEASKL